MKNIIIAALTLIIVSSSVDAQVKMRVEMNDGNIVDYPVSSVKSVSWVEEDIIVAPSIVGTWVGEITEGNKTFEAVLVIKSDTYVVTTPEDYNDFSGNWKDNGNGTLTLTGFFDPTFKYYLNGNTLKLIGNGWNAIFTRQNSDDSTNSDSNEDNVAENHEFVDLGLSVKWATCNVGANNPEEFGDYFAWGETEPKSYYGWKTYRWCSGSEDTMIKYCTSSSYGSVDNKTTLDAADDAAHVNWGGNWRMPTKAEQDELLNNCNWTWTITENGVKGYTVTSMTNGNSIFLPAAHSRYSNILSEGVEGMYWSSSLPSSSSCAYFLYFSIYSFEWDYDYRSLGRTVRAVCQ